MQLSARPARVSPPPRDRAAHPPRGSRYRGPWRPSSSDAPRPRPGSGGRSPASSRRCRSEILHFPARPRRPGEFQVLSIGGTVLLEMAAAASAQPAAFLPPQGGTAAASAPGRSPAPPVQQGGAPAGAPGSCAKPRAKRGAFSLCGAHGGKKPPYFSGAQTPERWGVSRIGRARGRGARVSLSQRFLGTAALSPPGSGQTERRIPARCPAGSAHGAPRRQSSRTRFSGRAGTYRSPSLVASNRPGG
ncbi:basic salivary proline-rich protein 4-like [Haemorhous mexicanus]|uniref:basic salivary proline-rich protein 4-like n=1 Tax=Haemorhous mexicanus TaxID=30427 RepID=UPI0028BDFFAB|nr:basic salivary proline-rich protein 4-like [Haemorhous mexicanus]